MEIVNTGIVTTVDGEPKEIVVQVEKQPGDCRRERHLPATYRAEAGDWRFEKVDFYGDGDKRAKNFAKCVNEVMSTPEEERETYALVFGLKAWKEC